MLARSGTDEERQRRSQRDQQERKIEETRRQKRCKVDGKNCVKCADPVKVFVTPSVKHNFFFEVSIHNEWSLAADADGPGCINCGSTESQQ